MRLLAPAKINLHLRVGRRRDDGFHPLLTWMCTVGLFDTLTLEAIPRTAPAEPAPSKRTERPNGNSTAGPPDVRFDCDQAGLPLDEGNLVVRIARAFAAEVSAELIPGRTHHFAGAAGDAVPSVGHRRVGLSSSEAGGSLAGRAGATSVPQSSSASDESYRAGPVAISLAKSIPVGAGLGGGSSDAARTLVALDRLWETGWGPSRLSEFAARFGSDVPFFVAAACHGPSAACAGRGEIVRPVASPTPKWVLLVLPSFGLATPSVYRRFDEMGLGSDRDVSEEPDWNAWSAAGARDLLPRLVNDLEAPAFSLSPRLGALRQEVESRVGRVVRMSGSGSSLFTLFDAHEADEARAAAAASERLGVRASAVPLAPAEADDLTAGGGKGT